jgi:hypothetical protein
LTGRSGRQFKLLELDDDSRLAPIAKEKLGFDARLVSLDEVMFEDGSMTRGDTVSRGLWD